MKHKESTEAGGGVFAPTKPIKEGLVSQIASKFQNNETVVLRKKSSTSEISPVIKELPKTSVVASVSRTESHQARFNSARAMFEKMGSADDLDSISSSNGNGNRGSRASSVQRSRSTSPFNTKVNPVQPPRSPETPETVSFKKQVFVRQRTSFNFVFNIYRIVWQDLHRQVLVLPMVLQPQLQPQTVQTSRPILQTMVTVVTLRLHQPSLPILAS